jgi:hypothetical protein
MKQWNNRLLSVLSADWWKVRKCGGNTRYCRGFSWLVYTALLTSFCLPAYAQLTIEDFAYIHQPDGIVYDPYRARFIVAHHVNNYPSFRQVSLHTRQVTYFCHINNLMGYGEIYHLMLYQSWGPYEPGWVLTPGLRASGSVLWAIDPDGNASPVPTSGAVPNPTTTLKLHHDPVRNVLYFISHSDQAVYKISWDSSTSTARFELLAQTSTPLEGAALLRGNPRYGPWSGKLVVLQNQGSTIYAIDPDTGNYTTWNLGIDDLEVIYPLVVNADPIAYPSELYIAVWGQNKIIRVQGLLEIGVLPGDLLIANEHPGQVYHVWWDGSQFQKRLLLRTGLIEDMIAIPEPGSLSVMAAGLLLLSTRLSGGKRLLRRGCRS